MNKDDEVDIINIQLNTLIIALFSTVLSILITYNQKLDLEDKNTIYSPKEVFNITLFNRILIVLLSLVFLYVNYKLYQISKNQNEDLKSYKLQISASILAVISGLIALYVVGLSSTQEITDVENPII